MLDPILRTTVLTYCCPAIYLGLLQQNRGEGNACHASDSFSDRRRLNESDVRLLIASLQNMGPE